MARRKFEPGRNGESRIVEIPSLPVYLFGEVVLQCRHTM